MMLQLPLLAKLGPAYPRLADDAQRRVARWEWSRIGETWDPPFPFWAELNDWPPAKGPLKRPPSDPSNGQHYGLDARGSVVIERTYRSEGDVTYERFVVDGEQRRESVTFALEPWYPDRGPKPVAAGLASITDGRVMRYETANSSGERQTFVPTWDDGRLLRLAVTIREASGASTTEAYNYTYQTDGELVMIRADDGSVIFRTMPGDLRSVYVAVLDGLTSAVIDVVVARAPCEPACAVVLGHTGASSLPPSVGITTEKEQAAAAASGATLFTLWNPAEFQIFIPDPAALIGGDEALGEGIAALSSHVLLTDDEGLPWKVCVELAKRLNAITWSSLMPVTDDFAVAAIDLDEDNAAADLRATLPKALRARLHVQGLA